MSRFAVVICGGGIAGVEGLLRLRRLTRDQLDVTLVCPEDDLVYRPLAVLEPFALGGVRRYPMERIAADTGARWVKDALGWVDQAGRTAHTLGGHSLPYDALLVAIGGQRRAGLEHAYVFTGDSSDPTYHDMVREIEIGTISSLAFVLPSGRSWPLPLYELALMTAKRASDHSVHPDFVFITPEPHPLYPFGRPAGAAVAELLRDAGIALHTGSAARIAGPQHLVLEPSGLELHPDRIVTIPTISGPNVRGIPGDATNRFLSVDEQCRVRDTDGRIFAAGDATNLVIKHGGIGAQQADTAAAAIAHLAGIGESPPPLRPVIRGKLLTGGNPLYLMAHLIAGQGWQAEVYEQPPWPADDKVIAEELGPYLRGLEPTSDVTPR